ncbi:sulfite exporter TauE/SafE family protein [Candidatus Gottesmanbacteria bacterium]|nr:sulfite exporter TauE/SafE family protein [Candidatus Gottesmanbacteria bacterium]
MNSIWLAFLTGLTTGGITCLAVQGGLLASAVSARQAETSPDVEISRGSTWKAVGMFLVAKLIAYTILGFLLGWAGSLLVLSPKVLGVVQIGAGLFMLVTAARIANIHPIFRYFVIEPPRWAYRLMRGVSRDSSFLAPALLGFTTVLLPCGVTQATMAIAVASASPLMGAAIMGAFVLGTSPIFFALGAAVLELLKRKIFSYAAAAVVLVFALLSINGGLGLTGSFYTFQNIYRAATMSPQELAALNGQVAGISVEGVQEVTIDVLRNGYISSAGTLRVGVPTRLALRTASVTGCTKVFTIPDYRIVRVLPESGQSVIEFTPTKTGRLAYACGMGMFTGAFNVLPKI